MTTGPNLLLTTVTLAVICVAVSAASKRPGAIRSFYHFDGGSLVKGAPASGSYLAVQDRAVPVILTGPDGIEATVLPPGMGALAGICFIRTAGGKLANNSGFSPSPDLPLALSSGGKVVLRIRTDKSGFFVAVLPAGVYRMVSGAFTVEARIESGKTTLVALQAGKRMVD
jgi:hypothetical protein